MTLGFRLGVCGDYVTGIARLVSKVGARLAFAAILHWIAGLGFTALLSDVIGYA